MKKFIQPLFLSIVAGSIVYGASTLDLNSGDTLDKTTWDNLVTEITTLKNKVNSLELGGGNIVAQVGEAYTTISGDWQSWTISGLIPYKPLIIGTDSTNTNQMTTIRVISGTDFGHTKDTSRFFALNSGDAASNATPPSIVLIPTSSSVELSLKPYSAGWEATLYAYQ